MRTIAVLIAVFLLGVISAPALAQDAGGIGSRENLDLPFDAFGQEEEEEEAPEVIFFYGQQYEGDGFFFCLDRSGSSAGGELEIEKREAVQTVSQFSDQVEFAFVFFDRGIMKWPGTGRPAEANAGQKASAIAWLSTIQFGGGSCVREGLIEAINFANRSTRRRNIIIYLGDAGATCQGQDPAAYAAQTLSAVSAANFRRWQLNTICVGAVERGVLGEQWCQALAAANNGSYKRVPR
jgi:hypothetical protein